MNSVTAAYDAVRNTRWEIEDAASDLDWAHARTVGAEAAAAEVARAEYRLAWAKTRHAAAEARLAIIERQLAST